MSALPTTTKSEKKKFVPKRRAPYLMQEEVMQRQIVESKKEIDKKIQKAQDPHPSIEKTIKPKTVFSKKESTGNRGSIGSHEMAKPFVDFHEEVSRLYGIQKKLAHYFVDLCIAKRDTKTGAITSETLCSITNTTKKTLKKTIQRMVEKRLIRRLSGKRGKGGFSIFELDQEFIDVVRLQLDLTNHHMSGTQKNSYQTSTNNISSLPEEWAQIDYSPIEHIGFGLTQIKQLYSDALNTPEVVQESINHFAFGLQHNPDTQKYNKEGKNSLNVLVGVLRKGQSWVEQNYQSPQEIAHRQYIERKKAENERVKKLEHEAYILAMDDWKNSLTKEELDIIISTKKSNSKKDIMPDSVKLSLYFKENIWPTQKKNI